MSNPKIIVSLSGGMDSTTLLAHAVKVVGADAVLAVGFLYPSKHNRIEMDAARGVAAFYGVRFWSVNVCGLFESFKSDLLQSGGKIPEGHYEAESMKRTVVPCRNMIFASVLAGLAESLEAKQVWIGVHAGDHAVYPDCRPGFVGSMADAVGEATEDRVTLEVPFLMMTKQEILASGLRFIPPVPYHLTRTCYSDNPVACGRCGACVERRESFDALGVEDSIEYQYKGLLPTK